MSIRLKIDPDVLRAAYQASTSSRDLNRRLGIHPNTIITRLLDELGLPHPAAHWGHHVESANTEPPEGAVESDRALARVTCERNELRAKYDAAIKQANLYEDVREVARKVLGAYPPVKLQPPHIGTGNTTEDAILGWADWHADETVNLDVMQGYNQYDPTIMCRRAQYTVDDTLDVLFRIHAGTTFETLYVFDLGDSITGDLLDENKATRTMGVFEALRLVAHVRARALCELASHIEVVYVAVPGNHPRRSAKMQWKQPTENGDWLIAQMMGDMCANNPRVRIVSPKAWTAVVNIRGWNHSLNHGYSAAKGGYGGIPWYAFQRADGKLTALESAHGERIHYRWYGHIHQKSELPMMDGEGDQFVIGSLMGGNEYALGALNAYASPVQKLVGCHEKMGATWRYPLDVKHADDKPSRYEDLLP